MLPQMNHTELLENETKKTDSQNIYRFSFILTISYTFFTEIIFTGQALAALSHTSKASSIGVLYVKKPLFSCDLSKTDLPSFLDMRKNSGANSSQ